MQPLIIGLAGGSAAAVAVRCALLCCEPTTDAACFIRVYPIIVYGICILICRRRLLPYLIGSIPYDTSMVWYGNNSSYEDI
eukprot:2113410-Pleurochrysis_carterae.AAC.1